MPQFNPDLYGGNPQDPVLFLAALQEVVEFRHFSVEKAVCV